MSLTPVSPPPWSVVTGKPETATRWPKFEEVTGKPDTYPSAWASLSGKPSVYPTNWANVSDKPSSATRWPSWDEVTGKPASFTPASHTHSNNSGIGGPYSLSGHTHSGYASSSHSHSWSTITSKPSWIGSSKPTYTALEVKAIGLPSLPSKFDSIGIKIGISFNSNGSTLKLYTPNTEKSYYNVKVFILYWGLFYRQGNSTTTGSEAKGIAFSADGQETINFTSNNYQFSMDDTGFYHIS